MKTRKPPREILKKSHPHKSNKDYRREDFTWQEEIDKYESPNRTVVDWEKLPDNAGSTE